MICFLESLKNRDTRHYPESLKEASNMLLYSPGHLNTFMRILFKKTK